MNFPMPSVGNGGLHVNSAPMKGRFLLALGAISVLSMSGCSKPSETTTGSDQNAQALKEKGAVIFQTRCFVCHGRGGKGDGPASQGTSAHPQDFTDPRWQEAVPNEQISRAIRYGGAAVGKGVGMPPNPDLTDEQVRALSLFIRGLGGS
jgi:cytochrome c oxidase cbb3-type subunit 3